MVALVAKPQSSMTTKHYTSLALVLVLGIAYLAYLDAGCSLNGVMTWHGKVCAENL